MNGHRKLATTYNLLRNRGKNKYRDNKLMASKITTLEQHLDYEAIIQIAEIDDQDLLYLNFDNQALGEPSPPSLVRPQDQCFWVLAFFWVAGR